MTRFFKVSLSVVALLLVAMVLFTGCANKALTAAEEAKEAVEKATADLEAAIAKKADASELAAKVEALTTAVEAATASVTDGDVELKNAIETAKKTLSDNAQTLISTLDVKIAGLLAEKADKATINGELARLDALVNNINTVTGGAISVEKFTELSTTAAFYVYRLELLWNKMAPNAATAIELYGEEGYENLLYAYKTAEVVIYRATSFSVIEQAYANFETKVKENPSTVDTLYYDTIMAYVNDASKHNADNAKTLYTTVKTFYTGLTSEAAKDLVEAYYADYFNADSTDAVVTENLLETVIGLWIEEVEADVNELGSRYLVYPENATYKNDKTDLEAARAHINALNGTYNGEQQLIAGGEIAYVNTAFNLALDDANVPDAFVKNEARMAKLVGTDFMSSGNVGANAAAAYVNALIEQYVGKNDDGTLKGVTYENGVITEISDETLALVADALTVVGEDEEAQPSATPANVDAVNALKKAVDQWAFDFVKLANNETAENQKRYEANKAVVDNATFVANALYSYLHDEVLADYKAEAQAFIDVAEKFFVNGVYDPAQIVEADGEAITAAMAAARAWQIKWTYINLDVYANTVDVTAEEAYGAILLAVEDYAAKNAAKIEAWIALKPNHDLYATWTEAAKVDIYDTTLETTIAWFNYFMEDGELTDALDTFTVGDYATKPTAEYYENLVALKKVRDDARAAKVAATAALNNRLVAIATASLTAYDLDDEDASKTIAKLVEDIAAFKADTAFGYDKDDARNATFNMALANEGNIDVAEDRVEALLAALAEIDAPLAAIKDLEIDAEADDADDQKADLEAAVSALAAKVTAFETLDGVLNSDWTKAARTALAEADTDLKYYALVLAAKTLGVEIKDLEDATKALADATAALGNTPTKYFADDNAIDAYDALYRVLSEAAESAYAAERAYATAVANYKAAVAAYKALDNTVEDVVDADLPGYADGTISDSEENDSDYTVAMAVAEDAAKAYVTIKLEYALTIAHLVPRYNTEAAKINGSQIIDKDAALAALMSAMDAASEEIAKLEFTDAELEAFMEDGIDGIKADEMARIDGTFSADALAIYIQAPKY